MKDLEPITPVRLSEKVKNFVSQVSDLYVDFLSEGRKQLATSLLRGLVYAVGTLQKVSLLAPGRERSRELRRAATVFHRLSLLIFASAASERATGEESRAQGVASEVGMPDRSVDPRILDTYDAAADLSGFLAAASRRHPATLAV